MPSQAASLEIFTTSEELELPAHSHEEVHLCLVVRGRIFERDGTSEVLLPPGSIRLSPGGDEHRIRFEEGGGRCALVFLSEGLLQGLRLEPPSRRRYLGAESLGPSPWIDTDDALLRRLFLQELAVELLYREARRDSGKTTPSPPWLVRVRQRLECQPESFELDILARAAGVHPAHLTRAFRERFGCPPSTYVRWCRIQKALRKLVRSETGLVSIAHESGFADQPHMTREFRYFFGTTPGRVRDRSAELESE